MVTFHQTIVHPHVPHFAFFGQEPFSSACLASKRRINSPRKSLAASGSSITVYFPGSIAFCPYRTSGFCCCLPTQTQRSRYIIKTFVHITEPVPSCVRTVVTEMTHQYLFRKRTTLNYHCPGSVRCSQ